MNKFLNVCLLLTPAVFAGSPVFGQTVSPGTFELSAVTEAASNRQTITVDAPTAGALGEVSLTSLNLGLETTYFIARSFGIGILVSHQRLSVDAPDQDALARLSASYFGPYMQSRIPLDDRSAIVLGGSFGGIHTGIVNRNTGLAQNVAISANGRYWLAGGGLSFGVASNVSFDGGVRYQSSTFSAPVEPGGTASSAGLLVTIGFSVYFK